MASEFSQFATTTLAQILQAYNEGDYLADNPFTYVYEKGTKTKLFPKFTKRTPKNRADDASIITAPASVTESKVTCTIDDPLVLEDVVTYQMINQYGGFIPKSLADRFGRDVGNARADRIAAFVAVTALARSASAGKITESAVTTVANVAAAIGNGIARLQEYFVPTSGYVLLLKPSVYQLLMGSAQFASFEYTKKSSNDQAQPMLPYQSGSIRPQVSVMGSDWTNATNYPTAYTPSAYRGNFSAVWGILWQKEAIAMLEAEKASENSAVIEVPSQNGWLIRSRMEFGMCATQPEGCVVLATS